MIRSAAVFAASILVLLGAAPARATTIGHFPFATPPTTCGSLDTDYFQTALQSGTNRYVVPPLAAKITTWFHHAAVGANQRLTFKVFRKVGEPNEFRVVTQDGPRLLANASLNTFKVNLDVRPGDIIGINTNDPGGPDHACGVTSLSVADEYLSRTPGLAVGSSGSFVPGFSSILNVAAVVEQSNEFQFARKRINRSKGTAKVTVTVPGPGELTVSGKGLRGGAASSAGPGEVTLPVRPSGKLRSKLRTRGRAKASPVVTFKPADGTPGAQATKVRLKLAE